MRVLLASFLVYCALAPPVLAQQMTAETAILAQSREASGGRAWDHVAEIVARGDIFENGFSGDITITMDPRTGQNAFKAVFSAARATIGAGIDNRQSWTLNQAGDLALHPGAESDADGATEMYLARHGYWKSGFDGATVAALAPATEGATRFERFAITPLHGRAVTLWINASTHLLDREQWGGSAKFYNDYRNVNGLMLPFSIRYMTGEHEDYRYEFKSVEARQRLVESDFDPPFHRDYTMPASGAVTVPSRDGIGIDLEINGKGPFRAFLDTGSINLISAELAKQLGLIPSADVGKLLSEAGSVDVHPVDVPNIAIGDVMLRHQPFQTIDIPSEAGEPLVVLGYEFLQRFVVKVDYEDNQLTLYDGAHFHYAGTGVEAPMTVRSRNLFVNATVDGFNGIFALDTGNEVAFELSPGFVRANDFVAFSHAHYRGYAGRSYAGPLPEAWYSRIRKLRIGDAEVDDCTANLTAGEPQKGDPDGNIGRSVLRQFNVTFDVLRSRLYLEKNANWGPVPFNRAGIVTDPISGGLKVMTVLPGSSGERAGLEVGDLITLIDGHIPSDEYDQRAFLQPVGHVVQLRVRHGNAMKTISVRLEDAL